MDSQFKQRLTGAVILVLLAVLLVPELLTGPKSRPSGPTSSATTPAQGEGAPLRSYDIDLSDSPQAAAPAAPPEPEPDRVPSTAPTAPQAEAPPSAADATPRPATRPARPAGMDTLTARAEPADTRPPVAMRGFAVQVGSFASRASADRLAADLAGRRFETFVSPVRSSGRQLFRVRVGPVADRAAAQALVARLKAAGQQGSVVPLP